MIKNLFALLPVLLFSIAVSGQLPDNKGVSINNTDSKSIISDSTKTEPSRVSFSNRTTQEYIQLMDSVDIKANLQNGYRIQLHSASGPDAKESIFKYQSEFLSKHPDLPSFANWSSPNWVLRIGNYRSRLEASQTLEDLKIDYPAAFILADQIDSPFKK